MTTMQDKDVVFTLKPEPMSVTTRDIGLECAAGYPHHQAQILLVFVADVLFRDRWATEADAIVKEIPEDRRADCAKVLDILSERLKANGGSAEAETNP